MNIAQQTIQVVFEHVEVQRTVGVFSLVVRLLFLLLFESVQS